MVRKLFMPLNFMTKSHSPPIVALFAILLFWIASDIVIAGEQGAEAVNDNRDVVVVLHGLGRSKYAVWLLANRLQSAGYRVERFGYRSLHSTPEQILSRLHAMIGECCSSLNAKIHFVGHSLGGLITRAYLAQNRAANLGHVVLLGTPNKGTHLVDQYGDEWWFKLLGPTAQALGTNQGSLADTLPVPDYPLGIIAGVVSAVPNEHLLPGADDGLVTVESTRLEGMTDFVVIPTGHGTMRYSKSVAMQIVSFLKTGRFSKE